MKWVAPILVACALVPFWQRPAHSSANAPFAEWPTTWDGQPMRPLSLSPVETRFAAQFPGRIGRFDAGRFTLVLRDVDEPTRMLHPAADCYRGIGYTVDGEHLEREDGGTMWRCSIASRGGRRVRLCERIGPIDGDGPAFTDASAWYWAALLGQSSGPWRAVTRVEAL